MKKCFLPFLVVGMSLLSLPAFSQANKDTTELLGLPGDNLDLYAVLSLFQKSKTIEAFEKSLSTLRLQESPTQYSVEFRANVI